MALDDLKETIETLRERIQAHRSYLEGHETRTRQVLIDPMLRVLGWDIENLDSVQLEHTKTKKEWIDYALMRSTGPIAVIEAKALGKPLEDKATDQAIIYAHRANIPYMIVSDGDHWRMFASGDHTLMEFQLTRDEPYACALQALGLWRPNLASGKPQEAATPVMIEKLTRAESAPTTSESRRGKKVSEPSKNGDWEPLPSLKVDYGDKVPASIRFPDSSTRPLKNWTDLLSIVAEHLIETGKISAKSIPVRQKQKSTRYLVHTEPVHQDGKEFGETRKIGNGLYLFTKLNSQRKHGYACWLLENFGVNPSTVFVSTNRS